MAVTRDSATNTLIALLAQDWGTPAAQQLIQLLFADLLPSTQP